MGCKCCIPASLNLPPEYFHPKLPAGIVQITEKSLPRMVKEFEEVVALSFCGTTSAPPEPLHQWFLEPNQEGSNPAAPLSEAPSKKRLLFFHSMGKFYRLQAMRHGGCFALQSPEGKIVAAASIFPPTEKKIYHPGMCEQLYIVNQMGGMSELPQEMKKNPSGGKIDLVDKLFTKGHAASIKVKHLYVFMVAVSPYEQGKGYGKRMMQFLNESADYLGVPSYLETASKRTEAFFGKSGYNVKFRYKADYNGDVCRPDGREEAVICMVRPVAGGKA